MVYFKRAEFWHRTGSVIGAPEQTSHSSSHCQLSLDTCHPKRPRHAGLEFVCVFGHDAGD